eukprot:1362632-Pleurochrysis_carterae.AAC.2
MQLITAMPADSPISEQVAHKRGHFAQLRDLPRCPDLYHRQRIACSQANRLLAPLSPSLPLAFTSARAESPRVHVRSLCSLRLPPRLPTSTRPPTASAQAPRSPYSPLLRSMLVESHSGIPTEVHIELHFDLRRMIGRRVPLTEKMSKWYFSIKYTLKQRSEYTQTIFSTKWYFSIKYTLNQLFFNQLLFKQRIR